MAAVTFDTLKLAQNLRDKAKFSPEQAAIALAESFGDWQQRQDLATKSDINDLLRDMRSDISDLLREMAELKADFIKWVVGIGFAQSATTLSFLKFHN